MTEEKKDTEPLNSLKAPLKGENMIAVVSGSHGEGKTFLTITLAQALGKLKRKTLVFDADNGLSNTKKQLGLSDITDLDAVIYGTKSLNQIIHNYEKGHFDLICGNSDSSGLLTMSIGRLQILSDDLDILSQNYAYTILDVSAGLTNPSKVLTGRAQRVIVLCTPEARTVIESYALIRLIKLHFPRVKINIVVNKVNSQKEGERTYHLIAEACKKFLETVPTLLGVIRNDTRVRDSIKNQTTMINRYPESEAAHDVMLIAKRIAENG